MPNVLGEVARTLEPARRAFRRIDLGARAAVGPHWSHTTTCPTKSGHQLLLRAHASRSMTLRPECLIGLHRAIFSWQSSGFVLSGRAEDEVALLLLRSIIMGDIWVPIG